MLKYKPKLILHIGSGKTGTTTLQSTLAANKGALKAHRILYPNIPPDVDHNLLTAWIQPSFSPRAFKHRFSERSDSQQKSARLFYKSLVREIDNSLETVDTVILSAEYLYRILPPEAMRRLHEMISSTFSHVHVIAYVREPSEYYISFAQQRLKGAHTLPKLAPIDHRNILDQYAKAYTITVRKFSTEQLISADIIDDFFHAVGVNFSVPMRCRIRSNEGMSAEAMSIMQEYRLLKYSGADNSFKKGSGSLLKSIFEIEKQMPNYFTKPKLHLALADYLSLSGEDAEYLASVYGVKFLVGGPSQTPPPPQPVWVREICTYDLTKKEQMFNLLFADKFIRAESH